MKKRLGLAIATLGTALTLLTPATAMARDRDDWGRDRGHERHERHEREEHWEHRYRGGYYGGYYYNAPSYGYSYQQPYYGNGYYGGYGYYNAPQGYYDRWGYYHRY